MGCMITRRQFLTHSFGAFVSISLGKALIDCTVSSYAAVPLTKFRTSVCIIKSPKVWKDGSIDQTTLRAMLDEGVRLLSGLSEKSNAWSRFFVRSDTIALKVNPIARRSGSTKPEVCYAFAEAVHKHVGVPYDQFIIFDSCKDDLKGAGYELTSVKGKIQVRATEKYSGLISQGEVKARISRVITDKCTALVNVPLLKTHIASGISIALKNHYGSIPKDMVRDDYYRYHMDGFKNLVYLNLMPPILDKTRLIVVDSLVAQYHRGPGGDPRYQWNFGGIIMGTDPVAVDTVCTKIVNQKRYENSFDPLKLIYLDWARQEGLGTNLPEEILVSEKNL